MKQEPVAEKPCLYGCPFCELEQQTRDEVTDHMKTVHRSEIETGQRAARQVAAGQVGNGQVVKEEGAKLLQCPECDKNLVNSFANHLSKCCKEKQHQISDEQQMMWKCQHCDKEFQRMEGLAQHLNNWCSKEESKDSPGVVRGSKETIQRGKREFQCQFCHKEFSRRNGLTIHLLLKKGKCQGKSDKADTAGKGELHVEPGAVSYQQHKPGDESTKSIQCHFCGKEFLRRNGLTSHLKMKGKCLGKFEKAGNVLKEESHVEQGGTVSYQKQIGDQSTRPIRCHHCGKDFLRQNGLTSHLKMKGKCLRKVGIKKSDRVAHGSKDPIVSRKIFSVKKGSNSHRVSGGEFGNKVKACTSKCSEDINRNGKAFYLCTRCGSCYRHDSSWYKHNNAGICGKRVEEMSGEDINEAVLAVVKRAQALKYTTKNTRVQDLAIYQSPDGINKNPIKTEPVQQ